MSALDCTELIKKSHFLNELILMSKRRSLTRRVVTMTVRPPRSRFSSVWRIPAAGTASFETVPWSYVVIRGTHRLFLVFFFAGGGLIGAVNPAIRPSTLSRSVASLTT